ncbi:MAG: tetratricopeptide repeat protein [Planctomycetaceae bacterium]|jgi:regulator of sirC expression with transglutaminase-like and TPR domain|nr:tetratricopeptide repeat protein [Planctomycetaceae bacterium]MBT6487115.1 tetratricopeptide repeat protein [Planctomycetaceae bacterium]MBT6496947.1 tetratricopeptide repeat protein [Planctomycetaceae bacterium]
MRRNVMIGGRDYSSDSEFQKLCARRDDADLTIAALELARDAYPGLQFDETLEWIDTRARDLSGPVAHARTEMDMLGELANAIGQTHGVFGDSAAYDRVESSYLHKVIETRRGIPISLSVLYIAVAGRVGIDLAGVSAPSHYLTQYESSDGPLFIDAFSRGRILRYDECVEWLQGMTELPRHQVEPTLRAATPRTTIIRMLNNLKAIYARQDDWPAAWKVQHRLSTLQPASYTERRDLAVMSVRANKPADAVDLLDACLKTCPQSERELLQSQLEQAQSQLARWN